MLALKIAPALTASAAAGADAASGRGAPPPAAAAKTPAGESADPAVAMRISLMLAEALKEDLKDGLRGGDGAAGGAAPAEAAAGEAGDAAADAAAAAGVGRALSLAPGPPVSIFDEIDAGVSGTVGTAVGAALLRLARTGQQVLCITHLPQVAGAGRGPLATLSRVLLRETSSLVGRWSTMRLSHGPQRQHSPTRT